ncbi:MAG: hypothetical protein ACRD7E_11305, partial [Bryobacteraceae bacterium]
MSETSISRRLFIGTVPAAAAAQVVVDPVRESNLGKPSGPITIVTTYQFEPHEVKKIEGAASKVNLVMVGREQFREKLREADVVYGNVRGSDLDYAPKLKWVQAGGAGVE